MYELPDSSYEYWQREISMTDTVGLQTGCPEHHCISIHTSHVPTEGVTQQQPVGSEVKYS